MELQNNNGNSFKDLYYTQIQNGQEVSELEHLYKIMCDNSDTDFCLDHIEQIFGKTNISSRLFKKLEVNNLIEFTGSKVNKNNVKVMHYKVIDKNKEFSIKKEIKLNKEVKDIEKKVQNIIRFCINPDINYNNKHKILTMTTRIVTKIGNGSNIKEITVTNLFNNKEIEMINAVEFLNKITIFVENYRL